MFKLIYSTLQITNNYTNLPIVKVQIGVWLVYVVLCLFLDNSDSPLYSGAVITEDLMYYYYFFIAVLVLDLVLCLMPSS